MKKAVLLYFVVYSLVCLGSEWGGFICLSDPLERPEDPVLAMNRSTGHVLVMWTGVIEDKQVIRARFFNGVSWGEIATLSDPRYNSQLPKVVINQVDHGLAVWKTATSSVSSCVQAAFFNGSGWSSPQVLSTAPTVADPAVSIHPSLDQGLAVWRTSVGFGSLETARFSMSGWERLPSFAASSNTVPGQINLNQNQLGLLSWIGTIETRGCYVSVYDEGWSSSVLLSAGSEAVLAADILLYPNRDRAMAIWSTLHDLTASFWNGRSWFAPINIASSTNLLLDPKLCYGIESEQLAAVWRGSFGVQGAVYQAGRWSPPVSIARAGISPALDWNSSSSCFSVAWLQGREVQYAEFDQHCASSVKTISAETALSPPQMAVDLGGHGWMIWKALEDGIEIIQAARTIH